MREVTVRKGEPIDRALKRLKTKLDVEGILDEMRRKARSASKRNKVKWRYSNKSEEAAPETAEAPASAPEA